MIGIEGCPTLYKAGGAQAYTKKKKKKTQRENEAQFHKYKGLCPAIVDNDGEKQQVYKVRKVDRKHCGQLELDFF